MSQPSPPSKDGRITKEIGYLRRVPVGPLRVAQRDWPGVPEGVLPISADVCAALQVKDARILVLTDDKAIQRGDLSAAAKANGLPEIFVPRSIVRVVSIPVLGTGKTDYVEAARLAQAAAPADTSEPAPV